MQIVENDEAQRRSIINTKMLEKCHFLLEKNYQKHIELSKMQRAIIIYCLCLLV